MTGRFEASSAVQWGNVPQWISAGVAVLVLLGAVWILLHSGRRTDFEVQATAVEAAGDRLLLDIRLKLTPVGSWRVMPYWPVDCECTKDLKLEPGSELRDEAWTQPGRCADTLPPHKQTRDPRFPTFRKKGGGMKRRRKHWGCRNRRVARIEIYEVRSDIESLGSHVLREQQRRVATIMNPFRGEFAEPREALNVTHTVPVDRSDDDLLGWRVVGTVSVPMEFWFFRASWSDSWSWHDDDFVVRTARTRSAGAHRIWVAGLTKVFADGRRQSASATTSDGSD